MRLRHPFAWLPPSRQPHTFILGLGLLCILAYAETIALGCALVARRLARRASWGS